MDERDEKRLAKWKAKGAPKAVTLLDRDGTSTEMVVYRMDLSPAARTWRGLAALGVCWGLAVVSVLVPIAHFVLVPGFFLVGPIVAWRRHKDTSVVLGGLGTCPRCGGPVRVKAAAEDWPLGASCDGCLAMLQVTPARGEAHEKES